MMSKDIISAFVFFLFTKTVRVKVEEKGCVIGGWKYKYGEKYHSTMYNYCIMCICGPEPHVCLPVDCQEPSCTDYIKLGKSCCDYMCPGEGCYVGGKKYEFGEEYKTSSDPCTTCVCSSSPKNQTCTSTVCSPPCTDPVWKEGVCCNYECPDDKKFKKVCTRGNGPLCASNNKTYSNLCVFETAHSKDKELKKLYDGNCSAKGFPSEVNKTREFFEGQIDKYDLSKCCQNKGNRYKIGEKYHSDGDVCGICECGGLCKYGHWCPQSYVKTEGPCNRFWVGYMQKIAANGNRVMTDYLPECNEVDGTFIVKQCLLNGTLCWCVDTKSGGMINGTESKNPDCSPYVSNCFDSGYQYQFGERYHPGGDACSICECGRLCIYGYNGCPESNATVKGPCDKFWKDYKKKIAANGNRITTKYLPECNKVNGYFSVKQCSLANGKCWCADTKTGRMIAGTRSETHCWRYDSSCKDNQYRIGEKYHPDGDVCTICMCGGFCESGYWCPQSNADVKGPCNRFWVNYIKSITRNGNRVMADYLPECSNVDGTFLLKQCSLINRLCWCVDNNTGTMIAGTESESPNCFQHDHGSSESGAYNSTYNYIIALYLVVPYIAMHST